VREDDASVERNIAVVVDVAVAADANGATAHKEFNTS